VFQSGKTDGARPDAAFMLENDALYGTTREGGEKCGSSCSGYGTVFRVLP